MHIKMQSAARVLAAFIVALAEVMSGSAFAQAPDLVSSWLVKVEGENRDRIFVVQETEAGTGGSSLLKGRYGFVDGARTAATAEVTQTAAGRKLSMITGADSVIAVVQDASGAFKGTITYKNGQAKPVSIAKTEETTAAAGKPKPAAAASPIARLPSGQVELPKLASGEFFADENTDWSIDATSKPQGPPFGKRTPTSIPGARRISTQELGALMRAMNNELVIIDVLDTKGTRSSLPGAYWMAGAGDSRFGRAESSRFAAALEKIVGNDKSRPIVFLCVSAECWESYNASLHALEAGYKDVLWYRGGTNSWRAAKYPFRAANTINW